MARLDQLEIEPKSAQTSNVSAFGRTANNRIQTISRLEGYAETLSGMEKVIVANFSLEKSVTATVIAAIIRRSSYEWQRLQEYLNDAGLTDDMLEAVQDEDWTETSFSPQQKSAFRFAMLFDAGHGVADSVFDELRTQFSEQEIIELVALCGHFGTLTRMAIALSFDPEE